MPSRVKNLKKETGMRLGIFVFMVSISLLAPRLATAGGAFEILNCASTDGTLELKIEFNQSETEWESYEVDVKVNGNESTYWWNVYRDPATGKYGTELTSTSLLKSASGSVLQNGSDGPLSFVLEGYTVGAGAKMEYLSFAMDPGSLSNVSVEEEFTTGDITGIVTSIDPADPGNREADVKDIAVNCGYYNGI